MPGIYFFIFILGLCVGSFLNVIIYRLPKDEKVFGRSYCPNCQKKIAWYDLIPVFSFCCLLGKCRYCGQKISWQYPIVEISTALIFLAIFNSQFLISNEFQIFSFQILSTSYLFIISCFFIAIFFIDLKHYIIPDKIVLPAIVTVFLCRLFQILEFSHWDLFRNWKLEIKNLDLFSSSVGAAILAAGFFLAIVLVSKGKWMGFGDVKLAFFIGFFLSWPDILVALFAAFLLGAIMGLGLIGLGKKGLRSEIPFGPFLVSGAFLAMFWGKQLIGWYLKLII